MSRQEITARWAQRLHAVGFNVPVLVFALRTALAGYVALVVAYALGLEHPHWAAMSAWASSQPMREHLLSRGLYRFGGSVVGVVYAVALVLLAQDSLWVLALGLALWAWACAFLGNLQRGYMVYGCMLAGYSAAMVVLLHHGPADSIWPFAWDRFWTVATGVLCALCISWCFAPRRKASVLIGQSRQALAMALEVTLARLRGAPLPEGRDHASVLGQLAQVEELLELYPEGSRTARYTANAVHWQQHHALELMYQLHTVDAPAGEKAVLPADSALAQALDTVIGALRAPLTEHASHMQPLDKALRQALHDVDQVLHHSADMAAHAHPAQPMLLALKGLLQQMLEGLQAEECDLRGQRHTAAPAGWQRRTAALPLHRDWVGARQAGVRAGGTLLVFGVLWAWTGWNLIAFGMLGLAVMLLVFSGFENPHRTMAFVLRGQLIGAALALLCQWLVWPWAQSGWQMVAMLLPFVLMGGVVFAHRRTAAGAMDTNMAMLILLAPVFPYVQDMGKSISFALAVVSGPALAWLVYRCIYPTNAQRRMRTLAQMMVDEVPQLAKQLVHTPPSTVTRNASSDGDAKRDVNWEAQWQAQLHHRLLKLVRWADKTQHPLRGGLPELGVALRAVPSVMLQLQQWRQGAAMHTPAERRAARRAGLALRRMAQWGGVAQQKTQGDQAAGQHVVAAWLALSQQPALPPALATQVLRVAQRDLPVLCAARHNLQLA